jgi:hypothetical protein
MKSHDLHLFDMKGTKFNMFLSYLLDSPNPANIEFALKNPGKWAGPAIEVAIVVAKRWRR